MTADRQRGTAEAGARSMQSHYPAEFEREVSCTEAELRRWLPDACGGCALQLDGCSARVRIEDGELRLRWRALPPRRLGLVQLPRLLQDFRFEGVSEAARHRFMSYFDLFTQRGGG